MSKKRHAWGVVFIHEYCLKSFIALTSCSSSVGIEPGAEKQLLLFVSALNKKRTVQVGCCYAFCFGRPRRT